MIWNVLALIQAVLALAFLLMAVRKPGGVDRPVLAIWLVWALMSIGNAVGADSTFLCAIHVFIAACVAVAAYIEWHAAETARMNPTTGQGN